MQLGLIDTNKRIDKNNDIMHTLDRNIPIINL
jgi:hypothetical protein